MQTFSQADQKYSGYCCTENVCNKSFEIFTFENIKLIEKKKDSQIKIYTSLRTTKLNFSQ